MPSVRVARRGFFPLDEDLQLLAGHYTPTLYEGMTRLSTWMPLGRAVKEVGYFLHTHVTEATVRRQTEAAGAAFVAMQTHGWNANYRPTRGRETVYEHGWSVRAVSGWGVGGSEDADTGRSRAPDPSQG
jgi:hypothetical protein